MIRTCTPGQEHQAYFLLLNILCYHIIRNHYILHQFCTPSWHNLLLSHTLLSWHSKSPHSFTESVKHDSSIPETTHLTYIGHQAKSIRTHTPSGRQTSHLFIQLFAPLSYATSLRTWFPRYHPRLEHSVLTAGTERSQHREQPCLRSSWHCTG